MKPVNSRQCLCCKEPFRADARNTHHQEYCRTPACRKASKAASQLLWLAKPENRNYHCGPEAVARVRDWQKAHPEYRERQRAKRGIVLQDFFISQPIEIITELIVFPDIGQTTARPAAPALQDFTKPDSSALQDFITTQPYVFVGLIAHFFNITLQDDIASTTRSLQRLGEDIANGRRQDEFCKTGDLFGAHEARVGAVQLGGSAPGAG